MTLWQGWVWLDPVVSLAIALVILLGTWGLFKQSLHLLFDGVPDSVDPLAVQACLAALPGVTQVHDLHIWAMGTSQIALTAWTKLDTFDEPDEDRITAFVKAYRDKGPEKTME